MKNEDEIVRWRRGQEKFAAAVSGRRQRSRSPSLSGRQSRLLPAAACLLAEAVKWCEIYEGETGGLSPSLQSAL